MGGREDGSELVEERLCKSSGVGGDPLDSDAIAEPGGGPVAGTSGLLQHQHYAIETAHTPKSLGRSMGCVSRVGKLSTREPWKANGGRMGVVSSLPSLCSKCCFGCGSWTKVKVMAHRYVSSPRKYPAS